jgi:protein O-GlcNAc transferase
MTTISEALAIALQHHQAGQLQPAEQIYRQILQVEPNDADAIHLLGMIAHQVGKHEIAVEYIERAIELKGNEGVFHNNLGRVYRALGRIPETVACFRRTLELQPNYEGTHGDLGAALMDQGKQEEAVACYRRALELQPGFIESYNLGAALQGLGELDEAVTCYRQALELKPDFAVACINLGVALKDQGKLEEAVACYHRALELKPDLAEAYHNLGNALYIQRKLNEAVACYCHALELNPNYVEAHNNLGHALKDQEKPEEAVACFRRALELKPDFAEAHNNLGIALTDQGKLEEAIACYRRVLELKPDYAEAYNNLGVALKDQGKLEEAVACYRRALELKPDNAGTHSNLVYTQIFSPDYDAQTLYEEHRRWNQLHAAPLMKFIQPHPNDRSPDRRLRVGYVSPDFRSHSVGRFILPLLESHDHESFEIFCYASVLVPDRLTEQCRAHADTWRSVFGFSDKEVAEIIRQDQIDILVDLTMHTANNRLLVFARKPAPVQVTYLAYCGTTGLDAIDYRLTDPYLDPPGRFDQFYSEQSMRLPETYWCYQAVAETPSVDALPALKAGHVSFGCLNNFCKVTAQTLAVWTEVLQAVPRSRLILHAEDGEHRDRVSRFLAQRNVSPDRLMFAGKAPIAEYLGIYGSMDVALDPFPYGGGTTTCDALWMGVPVVSLVGQTAVGRGGLSIMSNIGLPELAAHDPQQYVQTAVGLAQDLPRLRQLRATLRDRMQSSPLMDAPRFARNVEAAYRRMWQDWCAK